MKIFISWSGDTSRLIAEKLKNFIPRIIQNAKPFYTPTDIEKGANWANEINKQLSECVFGIICLTNDNIQKPWILFEAGALSNRFEDAKVAPILFGLKASEITPPLSQKQLTEFSREDITKLMQTINRSMGEQAIPDNLVLEMIDLSYPKFEEEVTDILKNIDVNVKKKPERSQQDILEEILDLVRGQNKGNKQVKLQNIHPKIIYGEDSSLPITKFMPGEMVEDPLFGYGYVMRVLHVGTENYIDVNFDGKEYRYNQTNNILSKVQQ